MIQIIYFKFCICQKHTLLCFIIFLDDLQLCLKFLIQKHTPYLRSVWVILIDCNDKIIHRFIVVFTGCLFYHVCSIRKWNRAGITLFICKHLCFSICCDNNWIRRREIIRPICFYFQITCQPGRETNTFQKIGICFPVIRCLDNLKWLFDHIFFGNCFSFYNWYICTFVRAVYLMFFLIQQISNRRSQLFKIIFSQIQIGNRSLSVFICSQGCDLGSFLIKDTCFPIRMYNILTCK